MVKAQYVPSHKNHQVSNFYVEQGYNLDADFSGIKKYSKPSGEKIVQIDFKVEIIYD
jgi:predicted enzyme involved in methoxymalonyl-ACP biosynthesis